MTPECTCHLEPSFAALDDNELCGMNEEGFERFSVEDAEGVVVCKCPDMASAALVAAALNRMAGNERHTACLLHP